jgi:hypothetical protein
VNIADGARLEALPGLAVPAAASLKFAIHRRDGRPGELVQRHLAEVGFDVQPPKFPVARVGAGCQSEAGEVFVAPTGRPSCWMAARGGLGESRR